MHGPIQTSSVRIVPVPSADEDFAACLRAATRELDDPAAIEAKVRTTYPNVRLRASELSGTSAVLYAYRDGHWRPPAGR